MREVTWCVMMIVMVALGAGCAGAPKGPGALDARLAKLGDEVSGEASVTVEIGADGVVRKLALTHQDRARVPAPVLKAAEAAFPGATITGYEWEVYAGEADDVYEVEVRAADGKSCELSARADGTVRYKECEVKLEELPAPVQAAIKGMAEGAEILEIERKEGVGEAYCSLKLKRQGRVEYYRLDNTGKVLARARQLPAKLKVFSTP